MKRIIIILSFISIGLIFAKETTAKTNNGGVYFYAELSPYGSWMELNTGVTVWRPAGISSDWQPYSEGQWAWTNDGWYWDSYEPFGYVTYHYGRWYYDDYYGWIWVPDNEWAPSWVEWRYDDDYIGWAPLPPYASFSIHIGIHFTSSYYTPYYHWRFLKYRYMCDPYGYKNYESRAFVNRLFSRTKYRTNYGYSSGRVLNRGVDVDYIRRRSGRSIKERKIDRSNYASDFRNGKNRNSDHIRTYNPGRDRIIRQNVDGRKIDRSDRKTTLNLRRDRTGTGNNKDYNRNPNYRNGDNNARNNNNRKSYSPKERSNNKSYNGNRQNVKKDNPRSRTIAPRSNNNDRKKNYNTPRSNTNRNRTYNQPRNNSSNRPNVNKPRSNNNSNNKGSKNRSNKTNKDPRKRVR